MLEKSCFSAEYDIVVPQHLKNRKKTQDLTKIDRWRQRHTDTDSEIFDGLLLTKNRHICKCLPPYKSFPIEGLKTFPSQFNYEPFEAMRKSKREILQVLPACLIKF